MKLEKWQKDYVPPERFEGPSGEPDVLERRPGEGPLSFHLRRDLLEVIDREDSKDIFRDDTWAAIEKHLARCERCRQERDSGKYRKPEQMDLLGSEQE